jgi:hypothetical protein
MRAFYLRYALFLRGLIEQQYSREDVGKLATFAEIAGKPELAPMLFQHPVVTPVLALLSALLIQLTTASDFWKAGQRFWLLPTAIGTLLVLLLVLIIVRRPKKKQAEIKRFLELAKLDLKEEE